MGSENDLLKWLQVVAPIVMLVVSTLLAIAGYFAKKTIDGYGDENKQTREGLTKLKDDFLEFKANLPRLFVLKDDHIRHMTILEKKIDDNDAKTGKALADISADIKALLREMPKRKNDG